MAGGTAYALAGTNFLATTSGGDVRYGTRAHDHDPGKADLEAHHDHR